MVSYLVMRNNLRRRFSNLKTYLVLLLIPIVVLLISTWRNDYKESTMTIGIECEESLEEFAKRYDLLKYENLTLVKADSRSKHTDSIMRCYDLLLSEKELTQEKLNELKEQLELNRISEEGVLTRTQFSLSMILMIDMMAASIYAVSIIKDKQNGMIERCLSCGVSSVGYIAGTGSAIALVMGLQVTVSFLLLKIMDQSFEGTLWNMLVYGSYITIVATGFGILVALCNKKELGANLSASALVAIMFLLSGSFIPVEQMPKILKVLSMFSPIRWLMLI